MVEPTSLSPHDYFPPQFRRRLKELGNAGMVSPDKPIWVLPFTVSRYDQRDDPEALAPALWIPDANDQSVGHLEHHKVDESLHEALLDNDFFAPGPYIRALGRIGSDNTTMIVTYHDSVVLDFPTYRAQVEDKYGIEARKSY